MKILLIILISIQILADNYGWKFDRPKIPNKIGDEKLIESECINKKNERLKLIAHSKLYQIYESRNCYYFAERTEKGMIKTVYTIQK